MRLIPCSAIFSQIFGIDRNFFWGNEKKQQVRLQISALYELGENKNHTNFFFSFLLLIDVFISFIVDYFVLL